MHKELPLSDKLKQWRAERPDEWRMDEFIRDATLLEGLVTGYLTELCDLHEQIDDLKDTINGLEYAVDNLESDLSSAYRELG